MSAYVVDRQHIIYLIKAAERFHAYLYWKGNAQYFQQLSIEEQARYAFILWRENIKSVQFRYNETDDKNLPGPVGEDFFISVDELAPPWPGIIDPVQAIKACHAYTYQACEHDEWGSSLARAIIESIKEAAMHKLPGYEDAEWGAPARVQWPDEQEAHNAPQA